MVSNIAINQFRDIQPVYYMEFDQKNQTKNIINIWVCKHPQPFSRGGGPLHVTYIFSIFQVSKM